MEKKIEIKRNYWLDFFEKEISMIPEKKKLKGK